MIIWYKNSILASIVSIIGCVIAVTGVYGLVDGESSAGIGILMIIVGICIAAVGKIISEQKAKKKAEQALRAQSGSKTGNTAGNTGNAYRTAPQSTGNMGNAYGNSAQSYGYRQKTKETEQTLANIISLAKSYAEKEEYNKELDTLLSGLSVDPGNAVLLNHIGRAYRHVGDYKSALDYYFRSAKADPNDLSIGSNIATAYMFLGEYEKADHYFQGEIRRLEASNDPEARGVLAITYANYAQCVGRMGDLNKARDYLSKAEKAGYKNCDAAWNMLLKA